jgi:hypothetical protein
MAASLNSPSGQAVTAVRRYRWNEARSENVWLIFSALEIPYPIENIPMPARQTAGKSSNARRENYRVFA